MLLTSEASQPRSPGSYFDPKRLAVTDILIGRGYKNPPHQCQDMQTFRIRELAQSIGKLYWASHRQRRSLARAREATPTRVMWRRSPELLEKSISVCFVPSFSSANTTWSSTTWPSIRNCVRTSVMSVRRLLLTRVRCPSIGAQCTKVRVSIG